ncbi:hypothetical protein [Streptomyces noursei]
MTIVIPRHPFPTGDAEAGLAVLQEEAQESGGGQHDAATHRGQPTQ